MSLETRNRLRHASGLLPKGVLELGLDEDGVTAWCTYRGDDDSAYFDVDADDAEFSLARELMQDHAFVPLLAVAAARHLCAEHRRRNTRH